MFYKINIKSWDDTRKLIEKMCKMNSIWAYRGQEDSSWELKTKFERDKKKYQCPDKNIYLENRERNIIYEFQRRAQHFINNLPELDNHIEWLSLLQHYGGTTRLLDFTYSFYVAAFFAMETSTVESSIWAVNLNKLTESSRVKADSTLTTAYYEITKQHEEIANSYIKQNKNKDLSVIVDPFLQHERIAVQQGLFLFPCHRESPFEQNLCATFNFRFKTLEDNNAQLIKLSDIENINFKEASVIKIVISKSIHAKTLEDLKNMNVTSTTLFPGLDGLARSFNFLMRRFEY